MGNKRKHPRIKISFPVRCERLESHRSFYTVFKDISRGGIKLISEEFIGINKAVKFEINLINELIRGKGRIAWCNPQAYSERYMVGVEFTEMDTRTQKNLAAFISNINPS